MLSMPGKLYPAGATTHSSRGVRNLPGLFPVLSAMADAGLLLLIHAEVTDPDVDIFDRERVFIERYVCSSAQYSLCSSLLRT